MLAVGEITGIGVRSWTGELLGETTGLDMGAWTGALIGAWEL